CVMSTAHCFCIKASYWLRGPRPLSLPLRPWPHPSRCAHASNRVAWVTPPSWWTTSFTFSPGLRHDKNRPMQSNTEPTQHLVTHLDAPLHYLGAGQGEALLLIPGPLYESRCWRWQMPRLAQGCRVLAPSLRGYWPEAFV